MAHVLSSKTRPTRVSRTVTDESGVERVVDDVADVIHEVTFMIDKGTPHTLTFHPEGTNVAGDGEERPRVVGTDVPAFIFHTAEEAAQAFLDGKV